MEQRVEIESQKSMFEASTNDAMAVLGTVQDVQPLPER